MNDVYIVSACRTAIGAFGGSLKTTSSVTLSEITIKEALKRANLNPENVDEVIIGSVLTAGNGQNIARQASINAGIPITTPALTINLVCGSGMKAVIDGSRAIKTGDANIVVVGGTENMSLSPYISPSNRWGAKLGNNIIKDTIVNDGLTDAFHNYHMGITAENVCDKWDISRNELDEFAYSSQMKAKEAKEKNKFEDEIVSVPVKIKRDIVQFKEDEYVKDSTTLEALSKLRPVFKPDGGRVTAGNSSGINDGAATIILASKEAVEKYNLTPIAKIVSYGHGGVDPSIMGVGPVPATKEALEKVNLNIEDIDLVESNEAFAAQSIAVAKELKFDLAKVNVNGGAIALGHPIGASGTRIIVTLIHEMKKRNSKNGLATLCIGGGMGTAIILER